MSERVIMSIMCLNENVHGSNSIDNDGSMKYVIAFAVITVA